jgi:non-specific serine/threonine protein kinase
VAWLERALALAPTTPDPLRAQALQDIGDLAIVAGDVPRAVAWSIEAVEVARDLADPSRLVFALETLGRARLLAGEAERAAVCHVEGLVLARHLGRGGAVAIHLSNLGIAMRMQGDLFRAVALQEEALAVAEAVGFAYVHAATTLSLADAVRETGDLARAESLYRTGLRLSWEQHELRNVAVALAGYAALAAARGQMERSARLCGAAVASLDRVGSRFPPGGQMTYESTERAARAALGAAAFDAVWAVGHSLPVEPAIDDALNPPADPSPLAKSPAVTDRHQTLTPRELEILRLIAAGLADREIAAALSVSRRTVTNHVASIRAKLGVRSRSAATAYAVRHGLA